LADKWRRSLVAPVFVVVPVVITATAATSSTLRFWLLDSVFWIPDPPRKPGCLSVPIFTAAIPFARP